MGGTLFDYTPGYIDVRFEHSDSFDYIDMHIRLLGATATTTECNDDFTKEEPVHHIETAMEFTVYMSSLFCPFSDYIRFLEAMVIQVEKCAFTWDPEGPYVAMEWERRYLNQDGFLTVEWSGHGREFKHRMMLETRQTITMLYTAFRHFVESSAYDPVRYEKLTIGEEMCLGLGKLYSQDAIIDYLKILDRNTARKLTDAIMQRVGSRRIMDHLTNPPESPKDIRLPINFDKCLSLYGFIEKSNPEEIDPADSDFYILDEWQEMEQIKREKTLKELFEQFSLLGWNGSHLSDARSSIVESYLAQSC